MRKLWKMRKIFLPQIAAVLIIFASIILAPASGVCYPSSGKANSSTSADGTIITTTYETDASNGVVVIKTNSTLLRNKLLSKSVSGNDAGPSLNTIGIDGAVHDALRKMKLTPEHLEIWINDHPNSSLKELGNLSPAKQRKVASIATFICSINRAISPKVAWREACALVYYSAKYGVPTELAVSIAKAESRFNPSAASKSGACGVMQVVWKVHNGMLSAKGIATKKDHMFDPERGVEAGILIISRYLNAYGTVQKALNRYYGGISHAYLKKVNNNMAMLERHTDKN